MKFTDKAGTRIDSNLNFVDLFLQLLNFDGIKYSEFNQRGSYKDILENKAGVYHFFSKSQSKVTSLYVGKGGFGKSGKWDLYKRLIQHRQPSQQDTIHGAIAKEFGVSNDTAIKFLSDGEIYIQFIVISNNYDPSEAHIEEVIKDLEDYCKCRLNPKYTDK